MPHIGISNIFMIIFIPVTTNDMFISVLVFLITLNIHIGVCVRLNAIKPKLSIISAVCPPTNSDP